MLDYVVKFVRNTSVLNFDFIFQSSGSGNYFERLWWFRIFQYFEGNVQGTVPRHYEWPLPWPRRWSSKNPQRTS